MTPPPQKKCTDKKLVYLNCNMPDATDFPDYITFLLASGVTECKFSISVFKMAVKLKKNDKSVFLFQIIILY